VALIKKYVGDFLKRFLTKRNLEFNRVRWYGDETSTIMDVSENRIGMSDRNLNCLISFFQKIDPLYEGMEIDDALKIGGGWRRIIEVNMANLLRAIRTKDWEKYRHMLENMFRNEVIYGLWNYEYFSGSKNADRRYLSSLDGFQFITRKSLNDLFCPKFGNPWGILNDHGHILMISGDAGYKAFNIKKLIEGVKEPVIVDLGSGFGADMMQLAHDCDGPLRIIMCDIPVTLATAFAQISAHWPENVNLITEKNQLSKILKKKCERLEFVLCPTLFVQELSEQKIDVLHNHGSLCEMDKETIDYYLNTLLSKKTAYFIEINSSMPEDWGDFLEIGSHDFPIPVSHKLISSTPVFMAGRGQRYLQNLYRCD